MKDVFIVMSVHPPIQAPSTLAQIGPTCPGAFETEAEAKHLAAMMRDGGSPAWVMRVMMGKFTKAQMRKNK